jgi:hypothetical protein
MADGDQPFSPEYKSATDLPIAAAATANSTEPGSPAASLVSDKDLMENIADQIRKDIKTKYGSNKPRRVTLRARIEGD